MKVQQLVEKVWCNESVATNNLKCNENFTEGSPKILKDLAHERLGKQIATVMEPPIPFHTIVSLCDADDFTIEKARTLDLTLEIIKVRSKPETKILRSDTFYSNPEDIFMETNNANIRIEPHIRKYCNYCNKSKHSVSNCSENNEKTKKENGFLILDRNRL